MSTQDSQASLIATGFSVDALKSVINAWFGTPPLLTALNGGRVEGAFKYTHEQTAVPEWSGHFQFSNATINQEGLSAPLTNAEGQGTFDQESIDVSHFAAKL